MGGRNAALFYLAINLVLLINQKFSWELDFVAKLVKKGRFLYFMTMILVGKNWIFRLKWLKDRMEDIYSWLLKNYKEI